MTTPTPLPCGLAWRIISSPYFSHAGLDDVTTISSADVWAVGSAGSGVLTEHWDGRQWSVVDGPNPGSAGNWLYGADARSTNDVWAVGTYQNQGVAGSSTLIEHWDGALWRVVPSPNPTASTNELLRVDAISGHDVWAVGDQVTVIGGAGYHRTLAEHWDGSQWSVVSTPDIGKYNNGLTAVSAVSANDVWAVGLYSDDAYPDQRTLTLHWDGTQWSVVPSANPGPRNDFYGVVALAADDVWAVGDSDTQSLIEHWDGSQWSVVPHPNPASVDQLRAIEGTIPDDIWAVGYDAPGSDPDQTLVEHWDGQQWRLVPSPSPGLGINELAGVAALAVDEVWAVGGMTDCFGCLANTLITRYSDPCASPTASPYPSPGFSPTVPTTSTTSATSTLTATAIHTPTLASATVTPCALRFGDVHPTDYFYTPVLYLTCHGVISGYADGTFRPYSQTTRAQMVKIVVLGFQKAISTPPGGNYTFADVPPTFPFFAVIETAATDQIVSGYACGGAGAPCDGQYRPYFRPYANVTRGQLAKITVSAAG